MTALSMWYLPYLTIPMSQADRPRRNQGRLDYEVLHKTGVRVIKDTDEMLAEDSDSDRLEKVMNVSKEIFLLIQEDALSDDIDDFLDENPVDDISDSIKDLEMAIEKAEMLRSVFRAKHKELRALMHERYGESIGLKSKELPLMKDYKLKLKGCKKSINHMEKGDRKEQKDIKKKSFNFLLSVMKRLIHHVENKLGRKFDVEDDEVLKMKEESPELTKMVNATSGKITEILGYSTPGTNDDKEIAEVQERYEKILTLKEKYASQLRLKLAERGLEKQDGFNEANLNINLPKFIGYSPSTDVFSFKGDFEKLHLCSTPKRLLPDLLKNYYLVGSALDLVKSVDNIDEIWERLKRAFGDPKVMMTRKLAEINNTHPLLKSRDAEKITSGLFTQNHQSNEGPDEVGRNTSNRREALSWGWSR